MKHVTVDTAVLITLIDDKPGASVIRELFKWHKDGKINLFVSNRVFEHDTSKMRAAQVDELRALLSNHNVEIESSGFRTDFSLLSGGDLLNGGSSTRTSEEMSSFTKLVGKDPTEEYPSSKTISRKLGDYDSLTDHFATNKDVFLTLDTKHYLAMALRQKYQEELGLIILSPEEFLANCRAAL
ncbi:MAG: hypothetical protein V4495_19790 [Pseudomonadota bacterium]